MYIHYINLNVLFTFFWFIFYLHLFCFCIFTLILSMDVLFSVVLLKINLLLLFCSAFLSMPLTHRLYFHFHGPLPLRIIVLFPENLGDQWKPLTVRGVIPTQKCADHQRTDERNMNVHVLYVYRHMRASKSQPQS